MRIISLILHISIGVIAVAAQATSSAVEIITTYSQNEKYYLKSVPYDNDFPTLRGKTSVYKKGNTMPLYFFERGFDSVDEESNNLFLSNDGEVILYVVPWSADEEMEGLKSITIYKNGKIIKSFTEAEITGCDLKRERCSLIYSNYDQVVDREKSNWGTGNYKKAFKQGVDEKEKFLNDFPIFSLDDTVYLTDSKKKIHLFDLKEGKYIGSYSFEEIFGQVKDKGRFNKTEIQSFDAPIFLDFPKLKDGRNTSRSLAANLGMKMASIIGTKDDAYKIYRFIVSGFILRDGSLEIEKIDADDELPKERILEFFKTNKFDSSSIPKEFEKWYFGNEYFYFRNIDNKLARQEKQQESVKQRGEIKKRMTAENINDVYIPKNLEECFVELDKLLPEIDKKEMQALKNRDEMIRYHMRLGMWMRNNWGLWGGSRLQKYFTDKGITHPDEMSSVVLYHYYDWLNGKKETWKNWERNSNNKIGK